MEPVPGTGSVTRIVFLKFLRIRIRLTRGEILIYYFLDC